MIGPDGLLIWTTRSPYKVPKYLLVRLKNPDGLGLYDAWIGGPIAERDFTMRLCDQTSWASTAPIAERCDAW